MQKRYTKISNNITDKKRKNSRCTTTKNPS